MLQSPADTRDLSPFTTNQIYLLGEFDEASGEDTYSLRVRHPSGEEKFLPIRVSMMSNSSQDIEALAARSLLDDLEYGRSWLHAEVVRPTETELEEAGVHIGCTWSMTSRWTSLCAVWKEDAVATQAMGREIREQLMTGTGRQNSGLNFLWPIQGGQRNSLAALNLSRKCKYTPTAECDEQSDVSSDGDDGDTEDGDDFGSTWGGSGPSSNESSGRGESGDGSKSDDGSDVRHQDLGTLYKGTAGQSRHSAPGPQGGGRSRGQRLAAGGYDIPCDEVRASNIGIFPSQSLRNDEYAPNQTLVSTGGESSIPDLFQVCRDYVRAATGPASYAKTSFSKLRTERTRYYTGRCMCSASLADPRLSRLSPRYESTSARRDSNLNRHRTQRVSRNGRSLFSGSPLAPQPPVRAPNDISGAGNGSNLDRMREGWTSRFPPFPPLPFPPDNRGLVPQHFEGPPNSSTPSDFSIQVVRRIVSLQRAEGSFEVRLGYGGIVCLCEEMFSPSVEDIVKALERTVSNPPLLQSIFFVAFLEEKMPSHQEIWKASVEKARDYLKIYPPSETLINVAATKLRALEITAAPNLGAPWEALSPGGTFQGSHWGPFSQRRPWEGDHEPPPLYSTRQYAGEPLGQSGGPGLPSFLAPENKSNPTA